MNLTAQQVRLIEKWLTRVRNNSRNVEQARNAAATLLQELYGTYENKPVLPERDQSSAERDSPLSGA